MRLIIIDAIADIARVGTADHSGEIIFISMAGHTLVYFTSRPPLWVILVICTAA